MITKKIYISCRVRNLRQGKKLTQDELARQLGISRQSIISVEKGQCMPSLPLALQLAHFFNTTIEKIFSSNFPNLEEGGEMERNLQPWSPFREISSLHGEIDRLFEEAVSAAPQTLRTKVLPVINLHEKGNNIIVEADLPGVKEEDVEIEVGDDYLILKGERKQEEEIKDKDYFRRETACGVFSRTVPLPTKVKVDKAKAESKDGILKIILPKIKTKKPKAIKLKVKQSK